MPLNLTADDSKSRKAAAKNKRLKIFAGISALALVPIIGSTLAATITINTGNAINFGQGQVQATACDSSVTVTAASSFVNATTSGTFKVGDVVLSDLSSDCHSKKMTISVYDTASSAPLGYCTINSYSSSNVTSATACDARTAGVTYTSTAGTGANGTITIQFGSASTPISASDTTKVTVESA